MADDVKLNILAEQHKFYLKQSATIYNQLQEYFVKQANTNVQLTENRRLVEKYQQLLKDHSALKEKIVKLEEQIETHAQNYYCLEKVQFIQQ